MSAAKSDDYIVTQHGLSEEEEEEVVVVVVVEVEVFLVNRGGSAQGGHDGGFHS